LNDNRDKFFGTQSSLLMVCN